MDGGGQEGLAGEVMRGQEEERGGEEDGWEGEHRYCGGWKETIS